MSNTTKSVDDELRSIIGEMPSYIFEYLELSDELKREWKHGSAASDFGGHKNFVNHFEKRITQLFVKQLQEAEIRARVDEAYIADRTVGMYPDYAKMKQATLQRIDDIRKGLFISLTLTQDTKGDTDD